MLAIAELGTRIHADHQRLRLLKGLVGRETVVHMHTALIRNHIRSLAAGNQRGVQPLLIGQAIHLNGTVLIRIEPVQNLSRHMDGVASHPGTGRMRGHTMRDHIETHRAVAPAFDAAVGRFADNREISGNPVRMGLHHLAQAVLVRGHLLMVVEHERQIVFRILQRCSQIQQHRIGTLHIGGATAPDHTLVLMTGRNILTNQRISGLKPLRREIVDYRHRIEMPGENHPALAAEVGGRHQRVSMPAHGQMVLLVQKLLHGVGERAFVVADGIRSHDLLHQLVQLLLLACGCGKTNLKFTHVLHYQTIRAGRPRSVHAFETTGHFIWARCHTW